MDTQNIRLTQIGITAIPIHSHSDHPIPFICSPCLSSAVFSLETTFNSTRLVGVVDVRTGVIIKSRVSFMLTTGEDYILIFKLFLDELLYILQLRQLDLFLLNNECWNPPLPSFLIPFSLLFNLVKLFVCHQKSHHLVKEV
jgi:hypothetical protein